MTRAVPHLPAPRQVHQGWPRRPGRLLLDRAGALLPAVLRCAGLSNNAVLVAMMWAALDHTQHMAPLGTVRQQHLLVWSALLHPVSSTYLLPPFFLQWLKFDNKLIVFACPSFFRAVAQV